MSYRIGVISDTHGLLREEVRERLQGCDRIWHAGDIHTLSIVEELGRIAPVCMVRGNADKDWAADLPIIQEIDDIGIRVLMIHNRKQIDRDLNPYDLIIFGHSHKYEEKHVDGKVWLNPGSCGPRRFRLPITMAMFYIEDNGKFRIEKIDIETPDSKVTPETSVDIVKKYLPAIIKEIDRGTTVEQLAKHFRLPKELVEQICRLYLTHPGIDTEGIITKMGI